MQSETDPELLAKIAMPDGSKVEMYRELKGLSLRHGDTRIDLPHGTANQAVGLLNLFEELGGKGEIPDDEL